MGRHSAAQDDDEDVDAAGAVAVTDDTSGRHAVAGAPVDHDEAPTTILHLDHDAAPTVIFEPITAEPIADHPAVAEPEPVQSPTESSPPKPSRKERKAARRAAKQAAKDAKRAAKADSIKTSATRADLDLLRTDMTVRVRAIGAVVTAFAVYSAIMLGAGRASSYAIWVWIPIVVAGVLVGAVLDLGHRAAAADKADHPSSEPAGGMSG